MKNNETVQAVQVREMTKPQFRDLITTVGNAVPDDLTFEEAERLTGVKGMLVSRIAEEILVYAGRNGKPQTEVALPAILRLISGGKRVTINACKGTRTTAQLASVFVGYLDPAFEQLNKQGADTPAMDVEVYELAQNATLTQMFGSLSTDLDRLVSTKDQVAEFSEKHRTLLSANSCTFFLLKEDGQFFVADVYVDDDGSLEVSLNHFGYDGVWNAGSRRHRRHVVVPQLPKL